MPRIFVLSDSYNAGRNLLQYNIGKQFRKVSSLTKPLFQRQQVTFVKVKSHKDPVKENEYADEFYQ